jgi:hypothetical protein
MLIGPQLKDLTVLFNTDPHSSHIGRTLLMSLRNISKQLQVLNIMDTITGDDSVGRQFGVALSELVCEFTLLRELRCCFPLTPIAIRRLSVLSSLRELEVANDANDFLFCLRGGTQEPFSRITTLCLEGDLASCAALLIYIRPNYLETLSFHHTNPQISIASSAQQLLRTLPVICSPSRFKTLQLYYSMSDRTILRSDDYLSFDMFRPLFVFENFLHLEVELPVHVTNSSFRDIGVSWPCLRELHLCSSFSPDDGEVTLSSLLPLSMHCADLEHVTTSLQVTLRDISAFLRRVGERRHRNYMLRVLNLQTSVIAVGVNVNDLATIMSDIFPSLEDIVVAWSAARGLNEQHWLSLWKAVEEQLSANTD